MKVIENKMKGFKIHPFRILKKKIEWRNCNIWRDNDQEISKINEIHKLRSISKGSWYIISKINKKKPTKIHCSEIADHKRQKDFKSNLIEKEWCFPLNHTDRKQKDRITESWRKQGSSRKTSTSASLTTLKPLTVWITTNHGKFLKRWEYQTTLPVSQETCIWVKRKTVRTRHLTDWFKIEKGVYQGYILSPGLFNFYVGYIMWMLGWMNHKLKSRLPGEISMISDMQMTSP